MSGPLRRSAHLALLTLAIGACAKSTPDAGGIGDPCLSNNDCATGFLCSGGVCVLPANLGGCEAGRLRCNGDDVEQCDPTGETWGVVDTCATGCISGACAPQACTPNVFRCDGNTLEECTPSGSGFAFVQECQAGCDPSGHCTAPVCTPFQSVCSSDNSSVLTCNSTGSAQQLTDTCPRGCIAGECVTNSAGCSVGELRCNGLDTQVCAAIPDQAGLTSWNLSGTCLAGCSSGACLPGGSCAGLALHAGAATVPADGHSSVLVYSDPIAGADGGPGIPDGQLFTISAALAGGAADGGSLQLAIITPDADLATSGTQVETSGGRIRFSVPAAALDAGSATVNVTAQLEQGGSCAAQSSFALSTDPAVLGAVFLYAEDFSTTTFRDPQLTTANWSTREEELAATWPDAASNAADGDLMVASGSTVNLATNGYAPSFAVLGLGAQSATVDGPAQGISGGDEILLWDAQGSAVGTANAGSYELLTVQSVDGSTIAFTAPVQNSYGAAADQDVATQRVSIQRIPHFGRLTVAGTLTTSPWDGTKGGLLFLRASTIALSGTVDVSGLGFRGGANATSGEDATGIAGRSGPGGGAGGAGSGGSYGSLGSGGAVGSTYGSALLGKLFLGAGGGGSGNGPGGAGGGAAILFASSIDFTDAGGATAGSVLARGADATNAGSGAGGTLWAGAPDMVVGSGATPPLDASGARSANAGGDGRIRVDAQTLDAPGFGGPACTRAAPACTYGVDGPLAAASLPIFTVAPPQVAISTASLLVALDASPSISFSASASGPAGFLPVSVGMPATFVPASSSPPGPTFSWEAALAPGPSAPSVVKGLQWQLQISK